MDLLKDRLFIGTLCLTVGLTAAAGVALAYDINSNRGQTVAAVSGGTAQDEQVTAGADTSGAQPQAQAQVATPQAGTSHRTATGAGPGQAAGQGGSAGGVAVAQGAPILVGALITQSGPLDASDALRAEQAYVQWINSQGGINGHKLNIDVRDDSGDPARGRPAFEQIVQEDHAFALVGECGPVTDATIVDEINQDQIPVVNDCLTSPAGYQSPYIWYIGIAPDVWQALSARYIYKHQDQLRMHKPYVLCVNSSVTLTYCNGFVNEWKRLGGTTCSNRTCGGGYDSEQIGTTRAQYESTALAIKQSGADSIVAELEPTNQLSFLEALQDQGMDPKSWPHFAPLGMDPETIRTAGSFANGIIVDTQSEYLPSEDVPAIRQIRQVMSQYFPDTPIGPYVTAIGWTPYLCFTEALRRMGSNVTRQNLINTLNSMSGFNDGLEPPLSWNPGQHSGPLYTRWATVTGPSSYNVFTGFIDQNGDPAR